MMLENVLHVIFPDDGDMMVLRYEKKEEGHTENADQEIDGKVVTIDLPKYLLHENRCLNAP